MLRKHILYSLCIIAAIFALTASSGWAAANCFSAGTSGTGENAVKIAVAANFVEAAKQLITDCVNNASYCGNVNASYTICSDSTGNLMSTELTNDYSTANGFTNFGYFFAADESAQKYYDDGYTGVTDDAWIYATGVPVFFAPYNTNDIDRVGYLADGFSASSTEKSMSILGSTLSSYPIHTSTAAQVAVANTTAPYGVMAHTLINKMMGYTTANGLPYNTPNYVHWCGNIGDAYNHVVNAWDSVKSGFAARSQVCDVDNGGYTARTNVVYIEFRNPDYKLKQKAIKLKSGTAIDALQSYINSMTGVNNDCTKSSGKWCDRMRKWCYEFEM